MKRSLAVLAVALTLTGCATHPAPDPLVTCIDVSVEYGIATDRADAREFCTALQGRPQMLDAPFDDLFGDLDTARAWAKTEAGKDR